MSPNIRPVTHLGSRVQEHGRLRFGVQAPTAKGGTRPKAINTWRFTSPDEDAIRGLAEIYGGEARPWSDPKANPQNQYECISESKTIRVFLPPDSITIFYELWTGAGNQRRCDGITATIPSSGPDGSLDVPCVCEREGKMQCKPRTRLRVILPEIPFSGVWRLDTSSWNAAEEMPAMEDMLQQLKAHGILEARLTLTERSDQGGRRQYVVPRLEFSTSTQALIDGQSNVLALNQARDLAEDQRYLEAAKPPPDEVIDAEIVDEMVPFGKAEFEHAKKVLIEDHHAEIIEFPQPEPPKGGLDPAHKRLHALIGEVETVHLDVLKALDTDADALRHRLVELATKGRSKSSNDLTSEEMRAVFDVLDELVAGTRRPAMTETGLRFPRYAPGEEPFT